MLLNGLFGERRTPTRAQAGTWYGDLGWQGVHDFVDGVGDDQAIHRAFEQHRDGDPLLVRAGAAAAQQHLVPAAGQLVVDAANRLGPELARDLLDHHPDDSRPLGTERPSHQVGDMRLSGGCPSSAVWWR